ncbi:MAG TPA: DUF1778 domain-containing protein [Rhodothermales bacterium]|nr:DUF1778 domain-containing protein [Rhodothermales bacterium]
MRLPSEQKALIDRAASYSGLTTTAFTVSTLVDRARKVVEKHELTVLSDSDRDRFLAILDMQAAPNAALRRAAENHRRLIESSED